MHNPNHLYQFDLAIVGGGLAGLTLAIQSANAGYRVVLFEKEVYPFHKVCGEYISMESRNFLMQCGVPLTDWSLPNIHHLKVSDTQGKVYDFQLPLGGFGVSRFQLDNSLYTIALQKGVTIYTDCKVSDVIFDEDHFIIQTLAANYSALMAVGSFGKRTNLDVKWGRTFTVAKPNPLNNFIGVKYHIKYPHAADTIALHNFQDGYCGMSRIEKGVSCLCYLTTAENLRKSGNSIAKMEKTILSRNVQLAKIFSEATFLYSQPLTISQISFQRKTQIENHVILLGDAAGMITPLCGNGMSMAMHASKIAFTYIHRFFSGDIARQEMEKQYEAEWQRLFSFRTRVGRSVQYFFGGSLLSSVFLKAMNGFPGFSKMIIRQTHGKPF
jgi:menaquinone-9 beta-reductase